MRPVRNPALLYSSWLYPALLLCWHLHLQLLFDAGAAYSIFMTAGFLALGGDFFGRVPLVFLLDFLAIYFAFGVLFDLVTLTSVLITTAKLGTTPLACYDGEFAANACVCAYLGGGWRLLWAAGHVAVQHQQLLWAQKATSVCV
jgi:hypothetical protein